MRKVSTVVRVILAALAIVIVALSVTALPTAIRAAQGEGTSGQFTAERSVCSNRGCAYYGIWRSDPPLTVEVRDVLMDEWPDQLPPGSTVAALYLGETDPAIVYPANPSLTWLYIIAVAAVPVIILAGAARAVRSHLRDRQRTLRAHGYEPKHVRHELDP